MLGISMQREDLEGYLANRMARLFRQALDRALRSEGMAAAYMPLFLILENRECTQSELAHLASVEQPTMAATLRRMERDGMISRRADPADGRKVLIGLTPDGRDKVAIARRTAETLSAKATEGWSATEREANRAAMRAIIGRLEDHLKASE